MNKYMIQYRPSKKKLYTIPFKAVFLFTSTVHYQSGHRLDLADRYYPMLINLLLLKTIDTKKDT